MYSGFTGDQDATEGEGEGRERERERGGGKGGLYCVRLSRSQVSGAGFSHCMGDHVKEGERKKERER